MTATSYIPYQEIVDHLDIQASDVLIIASDITRLAFNAKRNERSFDVDALIDSFKRKLTVQGTLIFPAYNFYLRSGQIFDVKKTEPITGAMALAAFRGGDFKRTWHPLHSFMVWGKESEALQNLQNKSSFGSDSPFAKFLEWNAKMLFIGTNVAEAFTYTHYVEEQDKVPYRHFKPLLIRYYNDGAQAGEKKLLFYRKLHGWTMNLELLQEKLEVAILNTQVINKVEFSMLRIADAHEIIHKDITQNNAMNIARFDTKLYLRDQLKSFLQIFNLYKTTQDKINYGADIQ